MQTVVVEKICGRRQHKMLSNSPVGLVGDDFLNILTETERQAWLLSEERKLSDRQAARHLNISAAAAGANRRRAKSKVASLKRLVVSFNGDPGIVDEYLRHTVLVKPSAA